MNILFWKIIFSAAVGGLIGLEREHHRKQRTGTPLGIRTITFISILGLLSSLSEVFIVSSLIGLFSLFAVSYYIRYKSYKERGLTTYFAGLISFFCGVLVGYDMYFVAMATSLLISMLLFLGKDLKSFAMFLTRKELESTLLFIIISVIILPILPNKTYFGLNPFKFWINVVLISGISFFSYIFLKINPNMYYVSFFAGLISAKAFIREFSSKIKKGFSNLVLISTMSSLYATVILTLLTTLNLSLTLKLFFYVSVSFIVPLLFFRKNKIKQLPTNFKNPLELKYSLKLASLIFIITQLSYFLMKYNLTYLSIILGASVSSIATTVSITSLGLPSYDTFKLLLLNSSVGVITNIFYFKRKHVILPLFLWSALLFFFFFYPFF